VSNQPQRAIIGNHPTTPGSTEQIKEYDFFAPIQTKNGCKTFVPLPFIVRLSLSELCFAFRFALSVQRRNKNFLVGSIPRRVCAFAVCRSVRSFGSFVRSFRPRSLVPFVRSAGSAGVLCIYPGLQPAQRRKFFFVATLRQAIKKPAKIAGFLCQMFF